MQLDSSSTAVVISFGVASIEYSCDSFGRQIDEKRVNIGVERLNFLFVSPVLMELHLCCCMLLLYYCCSVFEWRAYLLLVSSVFPELNPILYTCTYISERITYRNIFCVYVRLTRVV